MTTTQMASLVRRWFEQARQAGGPILPDGWFGGRAYENVFVLCDVQVLDDSLVIHLNDDTTLSLYRPGRVYVEDSQLVFADYERASIRWKHYGGAADAPYYEHSYHYGEVRFAVPPPHPAINIRDEPVPGEE